MSHMKYIQILESSPVGDNSPFSSSPATEDEKVVQRLLEEEFGDEEEEDEENELENEKEDRNNIFHTSAGTSSTSRTPATITTSKARARQRKKVPQHLRIPGSFKHLRVTTATTPELLSPMNCAHAVMCIDKPTNNYNEDNDDDEEIKRDAPSSPSSSSHEYIEYIQDEDGGVKRNFTTFSAPPISKPTLRAMWRHFARKSTPTSVTNGYVRENTFPDFYNDYVSRSLGSSPTSAPPSFDEHDLERAYSDSILLHHHQHQHQQQHPPHQPTTSTLSQSLLLLQQRRRGDQHEEQLSQSQHHDSPMMVFSRSTSPSGIEPDTDQNVLLRAPLLPTRSITSSVDASPKISPKVIIPAMASRPLSPSSATAAPPIGQSPTRRRRCDVDEDNVVVVSQDEDEAVRSVIIKKLSERQHWFSGWFMDSDLEFQFVQRYYGNRMETTRLTLFVAIVIAVMYMIIDFALIKPNYESEQVNGVSTRYIVDLMLHLSLLLFTTVSFAVIHWAMKPKPTSPIALEVPTTSSSLSSPSITSTSASSGNTGAQSTYLVCEILAAIICNVACVYSSVETALWYDEKCRQFPTSPLVVTFITFSLFHIRCLFMLAIPSLSVLSYLITLFIHHRYIHSHSDTGFYIQVRGLVYAIWILLFGSMSLCQLRFLEAYYRSHFLAEMSLQNQKKELHEEYIQTEQLLNNILPTHFLYFLEAEYSNAKWKELERVHYMERTCVLLSDIEGFTNFSRKVSSRDLLRILNLQFSRFDQITQAHSVSKVKTIGDAYFALSISQKRSCESHYVRDCVVVALEMIQAMKQLNEQYRWNFNIRIGVACGDAYAVILGKSRITFDIFGLESVEYAAIMERTSKVNSVHVTEAVVRELETVPHNFIFTPSDTLVHCPTSLPKSTIYSYYASFDEEHSENSSSFLSRVEEEEDDDSHDDDDDTESLESLYEPRFITQAYPSHKMLDQMTDFLALDEELSMQNENIAPFPLSSTDLDLKMNDWLLWFNSWDTRITFTRESFGEVASNCRAILSFQATFYTLMLASVLVINVSRFGLSPFSNMFSGVTLFLAAFLQVTILLLAYTKWGAKFSVTLLSVFASLILVVLSSLALLFENNLKQDVTSLCVVWGIIVVVGIMPLVPFIARLVLSSATLLFFLLCDQLITRYYYRNSQFSFQMNDMIFGVFCIVSMNFASYYMDQSMIESWIMKKNLVNQCRLSFIENLRNEKLVQCVLPKSVADTLRLNPERIWDHISDGCAAFIHVVGFNDECFTYHNLRPALRLLNDLFTEFDELCQQLDCDKIKSINDTFFVVTGLRRPSSSLSLSTTRNSNSSNGSCYTNDEHEGVNDSAVKMANLLIEMRKASERIFAEHRPQLKNSTGIGIKIGAAQGPIISGVVGDDKFLYDCFGTTINEASRMMTTSVTNKIQISAKLKASLEEKLRPSNNSSNTFKIQNRNDTVYAKGIGEIHTYFLEEPDQALQPPPSSSTS